MIKDRLTSDVFKFMKTHVRGEQPVLVGFSGGPDSLALLHVLLEVYRQNPLRIGLAHVDHGWREESQIEAQAIVEMAAKLGLPLHLKKLSKDQQKGNPEALCREERLKYFASLCDAHDYQAVLLGHHADDHAETVLKRLLEGATLVNLVGLKPVSKLYGINVWRPFLGVTKLEILKWLESRSLQGFQDPTNQDPKFLRARMRLSLVPYLSEIFGKEVSTGLCHIGKESADFQEYLDAKVLPYLSEKVKTVSGMFLDLSQRRPDSALELRHLIRRFCEQADLPLSRESLALAAEHVLKDSANIRLLGGVKVLYVNHRRIEITTRQAPQQQP